MARKALIIACWIAIWQVASMFVGTPLLLAGPLDTLQALAADVATSEFWGTIGFTFARIGGGFLLACVLALAASIAASRCAVLAEFLEPAVSFIKSVPVVCIIVLLLMWVGSRHVAVIAVALMVFPPIYFAVLQALGQADSLMLDMFRVFHVGLGRRLRHYYVPLVMPHLVAALRVVIGVAWKSGVAAEVIGVPDGSIGERIYFSKISLETAHLFAWTIVVVSLAVICEKVVLWALGKGAGRLASAVSGPHSPAPSGQAQGTLRQLGPVGDASGEAIEFEGVSVDYGRGAVLSDITYTCEAGSATCLMGPSGIGKTTFLDVASGLLAPGRGLVAAPARISRCFQENRLLPGLSAWDNVRLVLPREGGDEWKQVLDRLLAADSARIRPDQMSGGMKRKVALVRALAAPGGAVILDEPFTGLDAVSRSEAQQLIIRTLAGRTLVVATHEASDAEALGAQVLRLESGHIAAR